MLFQRRCQELKSRLIQTSYDLPIEAILLSGGLDSSILASIIRPQHAITIGLGTEAKDFIFSEIVADRFCKNHIKISLSYETLLSIVNRLIVLMKTFDPIEIRNSSVLYAGIEESKRRGYTGVVTGDGCDELFAGYDYMRRLDTNKKRLEEELDRIRGLMRFSSHQIGEALGIKVRSPYLERPFIGYAQEIDVSEKVGYSRGRNWGKFVLRRCFENDLGEEIAWRSKEALEKGANITQITDVIEEAFEAEKFKIEGLKARNEGVMIRSREHLYYYLLYRRNFPPPRIEEKEFNLRCSFCLCPFKWVGSYCRTCGSYPASPKPIT